MDTTEKIDHGSQYLVQYINQHEYYNEYDENGNPNIPVSEPSLLVPKNYNLEDDMNMVLKGSVGTFIDFCVRRPAKHRANLIEKILADGKKKWFEKIKGGFLTIAPFELLQSYIFEALTRYGPEFDAFVIHHVMSKNAEEIEKSYRDSHIQKHQIVEIQRCYEKAYGEKLSKKVSEKFKGSTGKFFVQLLETPRSTETSLDPNKMSEIDVKLFDNGFSQPNIDKFIDFFTKNSFTEIRLIGEELKKTRGFSIKKSLKGLFESKLKKCAKSVCKFKRYQTYIQRIPPSILENFFENTRQDEKY
ncbi:hypothetical protein RF11_14985 [Thelohanellus kitauei]|uniref:Uncharacterized protein n=1 Tax=Thelohanellus kitauei TaxID=669202 RepID=A0A0C2N948_THEKT|nr:hypothetical protein RF11_14985 [Thelohanellus kitauei]